MKIRPQVSSSVQSDVSPRDAKRAAVREGLRAADEGRTVSHDAVKAWLESWGSDDELPPPKCK